MNPCKALLKNSLLLKSAEDNPGAYNLGNFSECVASTS